MKTLPFNADMLPARRLQRLRRRDEPRDRIGHHRRPDAFAASCADRNGLQESGSSLRLSVDSRKLLRTRRLHHARKIKFAHVS